MYRNHADHVRGQKIKIAAIVIIMAAVIVHA
jgi:hypothetical protein